MHTHTIVKVAVVYMSDLCVALQRCHRHREDVGQQTPVQSTNSDDVIVFENVHRGFCNSCSVCIY